MSGVEDEVCRKLQERAAHGLQKYGVTVERTDLTEVDWLRHAQEEAMDLAVYLERLIRDRGNGPKQQRLCRACPYPDTCRYKGRCVYREVGL